ncbi:MAG TPA: DUF5343 domain-containing protein [Bryobacteraceae bacterium]|jgi:hypothetical protein
MANYPYTLKTGSLKKFFEKIPTMGTPDKVSQKHLAAIDFRSSNDRNIIPILRFLKFIDEAGSPTERYKRYRDRTQARGVLGAAVREGYQEVFKVYPNAGQQDHQTLLNFFSTHTGLGQRAAKATAETFRALCSLSDLDPTVLDSATSTEPERSYVGQPSKAAASRVHVIERVLSEGRLARLILPEDVTPEEIEKVKRLLDAFK